MKNIHVLPTDKPSRLRVDLRSTFLTPNYQIGKEINSVVDSINIYITSDEEIKEGDWFYRDSGTVSILTKELLEYYESIKDKNIHKIYKIILTTDQDLIKDGVQAIDDEFLKWFIKNQSCESVEVEIDYFKWRKGTQKLDDVFKIIIPKEEAKEEMPQIGTKEFNDLASAYFGGKPKQETPEEVKLAILFHNTYEKLAPSFGYETREDTKSFDITTPNGKLMIAVCKEIIKWQQERMYSEEDLKEAFSMGRTGKTIEEFNRKFKNK